MKVLKVLMFIFIGLNAAFCVLNLMAYASGHHTSNLLVGLFNGAVFLLLANAMFWVDSHR